MAAIGLQLTGRLPTFPKRNGRGEGIGVLGIDPFWERRDKAKTAILYFARLR